MKMNISQKSRSIAFKSLFFLLMAYLLVFSSACSHRGMDRSREISCDASSYKDTLACSLVSTARDKTGIRYRMGGTDPSTGFDCSGFVRWAYQQNGIELPRTTREQMAVGRRVPKSQLQPGDVVAFRISRRRGYHTGIYTGNGMFIHSPSAGKKVSESSMDDGYWKNRFIDARRIKQLE